MKNVFKKACVLGSAALLAMGMSSSMVGAAAPTTGYMGVHYENTVGIAPGSFDDWSPTLTLAQNLVYDGSDQQLITALTNSVPADATLYLRVADSESAAPQEGDWVKYQDAASLTQAALKKANAGTYHIFWYLDGGSNHNDITGNAVQ